MCRYGLIEFREPLLKAVIDSQPFQRLRQLKQLGLASCVYPGAVHSRFEHSLGVAHRAAELVLHLQSNQPGLGIDDSDLLCVKLAGENSAPRCVMPDACDGIEATSRVHPRREVVRGGSC